MNQDGFTYLANLDMDAVEQRQSMMLSRRYADLWLLMKT